MINQSKDRKIILCVPRGGLNDLLVQVRRAIFFAMKQRKVLLLCFEKSRLGRDFGNNVTFRTTTKLLIWFGILKGIKVVDEMRLTSEYNFSLPYSRYCTKTSSMEVFWRDKSFIGRGFCDDIFYIEEFGGGRGEYAAYFIKLRSTLNQKLMNIVKKELRGITVLHIRNTDYKTNLAQLHVALERMPKNRSYVLCSDDSMLLTEIKFHLPNLVSSGEFKIKYDSILYESDCVCLNSTDSLLWDLSLMIWAGKLKGFRLENGLYSGFYLLAVNLRKSIVRNFVDYIP